MDDGDLKRLMVAERFAHEHYDGLRGYPADVQAAALAAWQDAREALEEYRALGRKRA